VIESDCCGARFRWDPKRRVVVGERRRDLESASPLRLRLN
jgi:hypothetical protein